MSPGRVRMTERNSEEKQERERRAKTETEKLGEEALAFSGL